MAWLAGQRADEVVYSLGHLGDQIRRHVAASERRRHKVSYVDEGENLRGTEGALRQALDESLLDEQFLVICGHSYLCIDIGHVWDVFAPCNSEALMSVFRNDGQ